MTTWKTVKLSELGTIVGGATPATSHDEYYNGDIPWLTPKDLASYAGRYISRGERNISRAGLESCSAKMLPKNSILFSSRAPIGYIAIAQNDLCTNQGFKSIIPNDKVNHLFLYYLLKCNKEKIESLGSGTTFKEVSAATMREVEVCLPVNIVIQNNIAKILDAIDSMIENNLYIERKLYETVNSYYLNMIANYNYKSTTIGDYADTIYSGGTPPTSISTYWNGTFNWFSSGETRNRFVIRTEKTITQDGINNSSTKLAHKYDIAIASAGQGFTRGQTSILLLDTYVNQSVIVIHAEKLLLPFIFWHLSNRYEELRAISDSSSIRGSLTTKMLSSFSIPKVDSLLLQEFSNIAWSVIPQIEKLLLENERLTALRDTLLPKLMSGEIDVSKLENLASRK